MDNGGTVATLDLQVQVEHEVYLDHPDPQDLRVTVEEMVSQELQVYLDQEEFLGKLDSLECLELKDTGAFKGFQEVAETRVPLVKMESRDLQDLLVHLDLWVREEPQEKGERMDHLVLPV